MTLFDLDKKPVLTGCNEEMDWAACEAFEDYVYNIANDVSEDRYDSLISDVRALYDDYYRLYEG